MVHEEVCIVNQRVVIDGVAYRRCVFVGCTVVYRGAEGFELDGCRFERCNWEFEGTAGATLRLVQMITGSDRLSDTVGPSRLH